MTNRQLDIQTYWISSSNYYHFAACLALSAGLPTYACEKCEKAFFVIPSQLFLYTTCSYLQATNKMTQEGLFVCTAFQGTCSDRWDDSSLTFSILWKSIIITAQFRIWTCIASVELVLFNFNSMYLFSSHTKSLQMHRVKIMGDEDAIILVLESQGH